MRLPPVARRAGEEGEGAGGDKAAVDGEGEGGAEGGDEDADLQVAGGGGPDSSPSSVGPPTKVAPLPTWRLPVAVKSSAISAEPSWRKTFPATVVGPPVTQTPLTNTFVE